MCAGLYCSNLVGIFCLGTYTCGLSMGMKYEHPVQWHRPYRICAREIMKTESEDSVGGLLCGRYGQSRWTWLKIGVIGTLDIVLLGEPYFSRCQTRLDSVCIAACDAKARDQRWRLAQSPCILYRVHEFIILILYTRASIWNISNHPQIPNWRPAWWNLTEPKTARVWSSGDTALGLLSQELQCRQGLERSHFQRSQWLKIQWPDTKRNVTEWERWRSCRKPSSLFGLPVGTKARGELFC